MSEGAFRGGSRGWSPAAARGLRFRRPLGPGTIPESCPGHPQRGALSKVNCPSCGARATGPSGDRCPVCGASLTSADLHATTMRDLIAPTLTPLGPISDSPASCSGPTIFPPGSRVGRTIAHFQVEQRLGAGGMGEVYLARDLALGRLAALKLLPEGFSPSLRARLLREAW